MINDSIKMVGTPTFILTGADGVEKLRFTQPNLVVQIGKVFTANRMIGNDTAVMSHMAVGTGTTSPVSTDTSLITEIGRVALTSATQVDNVVTYVATFPPSVGTGPLTEAAIFNSDTDGIMVARTSFAVVNKADIDTLTIQWAITVQ